MAGVEIALHGAPDSCIGTSDARNVGLQVMQLDMTQEIMDALLQSVRDGKPPQILFGRAPVRLPIAPFTLCSQIQLLAKLLLTFVDTLTLTEGCSNFVMATEPMC
jgi:hypothetical protein